MHANSLVLIWSFADPIHPVVIEQHTFTLTDTHIHTVTQTDRQQSEDTVTQTDRQTTESRHIHTDRQTDTYIQSHRQTHN